MKLANKLFIAFSATTVITVTLLLLIWQWGLQRAFLGFIEQAESKSIEEIERRLTHFYDLNGGWHVLRGNEGAWRGQFNDLHRPPPKNRNLNNRRRNPPPKNNDQGTLRRLSLYDVNKQVVFGRGAMGENPIIRILHDNGNNIIGYVGVVPERLLENGPDTALLQKQLTLGLVTGVIALLCSLSIAYWISRHFSQPIERLREATSELKQGNLDWRLTISSGDEIQQLAEDVNALASRLQKNKNLRQEWSSNIAHELRTPIAILQNQCEAILDGVFELSEDRITLLLGETQRLHRLVEDLYQLSLAESDDLHYQLCALSPNELVQRAVNRFHIQCSEANLMLTLEDLTVQPVAILGDAERLVQVFDNLLQNSLRYTDSPGKIHVSVKSGEVQSQGSSVVICIEDSSPGVKQEEQSRLFTRLYRVEKSRSRMHGGSGLGLTICRAIIDAHGGSIMAKQSRLGGLSVIITIPLIQGQKP